MDIPELEYRKIISMVQNSSIISAEMTAYADFYHSFSNTVYVHTDRRDGKQCFLYGLIWIGDMCSL